MQPGKGVFGQDRDQRYDLHGGIHLAEEAGAEIPQRAGGKEESGDKQYPEIAAEDQYRDVAGHQADVGEHEEEGTEQELVGDRVEIQAKRGLLTEPPRDEAVEAVADTRKHEERKGGTEVAVEDFNDEKRDNKESQQRQQVGRGTELSEEGHGDRQILAQAKVLAAKRLGRRWRWAMPETLRQRG